MSTQAVTKLDRAPRGRVDKFAERRAELAEVALQTLSELGYARTSLREIAENSEFSHGVLHYYFSDKVDLIICAVRQYKARCVTRYDRVTAEATTYEALTAGFLAGLSETLRDDARMHRLWYDLRAQTLFEPALREDVAEIDKILENMIWRVISRFADLTGEPQTLPPPVVYAMIDGLFQQALLRHLSGDTGAIAQLQADVGMALAKIAPNHAAAPTSAFQPNGGL